MELYNRSVCIGIYIKLNKMQHDLNCHVSTHFVSSMYAIFRSLNYSIKQKALENFI